MKQTNHPKLKLDTQKIRLLDGKQLVRVEGGATSKSATCPTAVPQGN
jgi:hypothetical protein